MCLSLRDTNFIHHTTHIYLPDEYSNPINQACILPAIQPVPAAVMVTTVTRPRSGSHQKEERRKKEERERE